MLLNFQKRFVPFIEAGEKTHTIRATRRITPKVGETCHCYTGLRQKGARLLGRWPCARVEEIRIFKDQIEYRPDDTKISGKSVSRVPDAWPWEIRVQINGDELDRSERDALAVRDGFESFEDMAGFWRKEHGKGKPLNFHGHIIHWEFRRDSASR